MKIVDFTSNVEDALDSLAGAMLAIEAGPQRAAYLKARISDAPPAALVRVLSRAQRAATEGARGPRALVDTFALLVDEGGLAKEQRLALVTMAVVLDEHAIVPLIEPNAVNDPPPAPHARRRKGPNEDGAETLGRRKSLARTARGELLLKLLDDPHADVVKNALLNPALTELLVVRVAARRPAPAAVLEVVARSKYMNRHAVRRALAMNPSCPPALAVRIVSGMSESDLLDVAAEPGLCASVRATVDTLLKRPE